jgi:isopenicillin N synthase-like dioxygenase
MVEKSPNLPGIIKENAELFDSYISISQHITQTMLSCLSSGLKLQDTSCLEHKHRSCEPSNTTLVLLSYPPNMDDHNIGHNKHTDIGSLTLLFSNQWGLQVVTPEGKRWTSVQPKPGHAIINVGDSLRFLSGKRLKSCLHRVVPLNPTEHRYSIAYFLRPERAVEFKDLEDRKVTAEEWHTNKYIMFAEPHEVQAKSQVMTGGMEQMLVAAGV